MEFRVQDDGPGLSAAYSRENQGIGLANTRARLRQLYGEDAKLAIENCNGGGTIVTITFPFHDSHREIMKTRTYENTDRG